MTVTVPRPIVMQVVKNSGCAMHHVEFNIDANFVERLGQLRSLVPPLSTFNKQRDLVIDKVRVRLPTAVWRSGRGLPFAAEGSCMVISAQGQFSCGGRDVQTREKMVTYTFPIARLLDLHATRPVGETLFIRDGTFTNDEPADAPAGRWMASLQDTGPVRAAQGISDFDTLPGPPLDRGMSSASRGSDSVID